MSDTTTHAVAAAACYVTIPGAGAVLLYHGAPVPDGVTDDDRARLEEDGLIRKVKASQVDDLGAHPSDVPLDLESAAEPLDPFPRLHADERKTSSTRASRTETDGAKSAKAKE